MLSYEIKSARDDQGNEQHKKNLSIILIRLQFDINKPKENI